MMRQVVLVVGALASLGLASCREAHRNIVEITTRGGAAFMVVEPQANYVRICQAGDYAVSRDADMSGLRAVHGDSSEGYRDPTKGDEIPWDTIVKINFTDLIGNIGGELGGDFCWGQPHAVAATVALRSGDVIQRQLIDTTDRGIEGASERGVIVIPIREIAMLAAVPDQGWPWSKQHNDPATHEELPLIRVEPVNGPIRNFWSPETGTVHEKETGNRSLRTPDYTRPGLPALIGGARIAIPWNSLKRVEIGGERMPMAGKIEARLVGKIFYSDGRSEEVGISDGVITTTINGGDSILLRDVAVIEIVPKEKRKL